VNDEYLTEEQQAEKVRQWLRENGLFIVAGVVLGLGGLFGWQAWEQRSLETAADASVVWEQLRDAAEGQRYNEVDQTLAILESDFTATPYLDQARLLVARIRMEQNDTAAAVAQLQQVATEGHDPNLRRLAEFRHAQIMIAEEDYDAALALLGEVEKSALAGLYHELRGDALFGRGDLQAARDAYQSALDADIAGGIDRSFVQMKLDDVASAVAAAAEARSSDAG